MRHLLTTIRQWATGIIRGPITTAALIDAQANRIQLLEARIELLSANLHILREERDTLFAASIAPIYPIHRIHHIYFRSLISLN
jgi:hypothetical protein